MEKYTGEYWETKSIRIYTGNGYEDFVAGKKVSSAHIISDQKERTVKNIVIYANGNIFVDFEEEGESFAYKGVNFRYSQF